MFADGIAFMCFCDAECVLSAIAKFLIHLLGEAREGRGGGNGREENRVGSEAVNYTGMQNGLHEK